MFPLTSWLSYQSKHTYKLQITYYFCCPFFCLREVFYKLSTFCSWSVFIDSRISVVVLYGCFNFARITFPSSSIHQEYDKSIQYKMGKLIFVEYLLHRSSWATGYNQPPTQTNKSEKEELLSPCVLFSLLILLFSLLIFLQCFFCVENFDMSVYRFHSSEMCFLFHKLFLFNGNISCMSSAQTYFKSLLHCFSYLSNSILMFLT